MDIASACLVGHKCRYNGEASEDAKMKKMYEQGLVMPVCPELLAKLPVPRCPSEIVGGDGEDVLAGRVRVMAQNGTDITQEFLEGAEKTLQIAQQCGAERAYLKSKSPSCGCGQIYDGTFSGQLREGDGVTSVLLKKNGIEVIEV
jgi:uncharacterized protein YbbK (DUF523 family)